MSKSKSPRSQKLKSSKNTQPRSSDTHSQLISATKSVHISGPLPPPESLKGYENVSPGAADRIITMAENEQSYRHEQGRRRDRFQGSSFILSQLLGFGIGVIGIISAAYLLLHDKHLSGAGFFLTSLATLVGTYLYEKRK